MSASSTPSAGSAVPSAISARPRHQKSMSASGHPIKVALPAIKDGTETYRPRYFSKYSIYFPGQETVNK